MRRKKSQLGECSMCTSICKEPSKNIKASRKRSSYGGYTIHDDYQERCRQN